MKAQALGVLRVENTYYNLVTLGCLSNQIKKYITMTERKLYLK